MSEAFRAMRTDLTQEPHVHCKPRLDMRPRPQQALHEHEEPVVH
jgi:hypothetical protein